MTQNPIPQPNGKPKGLPKSGGRKKGIQNKTNTSIREAILESGISPLQFLVDTFRNERDEDDNPVDFEIRIKAAIAAAPYIHAKVAQEINLGAPEDKITKFTLEIMDYKEKDE